MNNHNLIFYIGAMYKKISLDQLNELNNSRSKELDSIGQDDPIILTLPTKHKFALVPVRKFNELLERLEDYEDIVAIQEARNEKLIPHEEFWKLVKGDNAS